MSTSENEYAEDNDVNYYDAEDNENHEHSKEIYHPAEKMLTTKNEKNINSIKKRSC